MVILQALHDYRYLNSLQLRDLFFPSLRAAQARIQQLRDLGVIHRWKMIEHPGLTWRHSLLMLSPRGARVLASFHADQPASYVERARQASAYCWRVPHDLAANDFFVWLASISRDIPDQGLQTWCGEDWMRAHRQKQAESRRDRVPVPDGYGTYLTPKGRIQFDLEWDRGTESSRLLWSKVKAYYEYMARYSNAADHNVLIVVPTDAREGGALRAVDEALPRPRWGITAPICSMWVTTADRLATCGPLGPIWSGRRPPEGTPLWPVGVRLTDMPVWDRQPFPAADCIGKRDWWVRRPAGGEVLP